MSLAANFKAKAKIAMMSIKPEGTMTIDVSMYFLCIIRFLHIHFKFYYMIKKIAESTKKVTLQNFHLFRVSSIGYSSKNYPKIVNFRRLQLTILEQY